MPVDATTLDPERAFALLGEPTRLAILRAVWAAEEPIRFTELRERLGTPDSGRFNYHLDRLRGHYLHQDDDGYTLTQAGREVVRAVLAGTLTERPATDPEPIDAPCPDCGGALLATFADRGRIECGDCGATVLWNEFPPAGLAGRDASERARALERWTRRRFRLAMDGVCPSCAAAVETEPEGRDATTPAGIANRYACPNCGYAARVPLVGHLVDHPAVVAFGHRHGLAITDQPYWALRAQARAFGVTVLEEDPWRAEVAIPAGDERLVLIVDDDLAVVGVDRSA